MRFPRVFKNFMVFSVLFSFIAGSVVALVAVAATKLGEQEGGRQVAALYGCYVLTAMTFASSLVQSAGSKAAAVLGLSLYCAWPISFVVTSLLEFAPQ